MSLRNDSFASTNRYALTDLKGVSQTDIQHYERLFDTFDVEQTGYLDPEAIQFLLRCLGILIEDDNLEKLIDLFDVTGDGKIDFNEFVSLMNRISELDTGRTISKREEQRHINKITTARFTNDKPARWLWDTIILVISTYYCFRVVLEYYYVPHIETPTLTCEVIINLILLADVGVMFNTAFKDDNGNNVVDIRRVVSRYLRTTFVFDILGALPFDLIFLMLTRNITGIRIVRSVRLLRMVRVFKTLFLETSFTGVWTPAFVKFTYKFAPLLRSVFVLCVTLNLVVTGWLLLRRQVGREMSYDQALYFILYTLSTVGYSDQGISTEAERIYCMVLFLCGMVINGIVISQVSAFLSKADMQTERSTKMRETLAVLEHYEIPAEAKVEILSFQSHLLNHNLGSSHASLISNLPLSIQESLALFMKIKYISMVPMFSKASQECKMALAQSLVNVVYRPQEFIIVAGERGREMYFLGHGVANVIHPTGVYLATLRKGNFFGEFALLVEEAHRTASIKALTYCDVFRLEKDSFVQIMTKFPTFRDTMKEEMEDRVQQFQKQNNAIIPKKGMFKRKTKNDSYDRLSMSEEMVGHHSRASKNMFSAFKENDLDPQPSVAAATGEYQRSRFSVMGSRMGFFMGGDENTVTSGNKKQILNGSSPEDDEEDIVPKISSSIPSGEMTLLQERGSDGDGAGHATPKAGYSPPSLERTGNGLQRQFSDGTDGSRSNTTPQGPLGRSPAVGGGGGEAGNPFDTFESIANLADPAMGGGDGVRHGRVASEKPAAQNSRRFRDPQARPQPYASRTNLFSNPFQFGEQVESAVAASSSMFRGGDGATSRRFASRDYESLVNKMKRLEKVVEGRENAMRAAQDDPSFVYVETVSPPGASASHTSHVTFNLGNDLKKPPVRFSDALDEPSPPKTSHNEGVDNNSKEVDSQPTLHAEENAYHTSDLQT